MAAEWARVLGHRDFGVLHNFFAVGGDSIKAVQVVAGLGEDFGLDLRMSAVFHHPVLASFALALEYIVSEGEAPRLDSILSKDGDIESQLRLLEEGGS